VHNGAGYRLWVKPAAEERRPRIECKANDSVRAPPQYYSLLEPGRRLIEPCKERALNAGTDGHFGNDKQTSDQTRKQPSNNGKLTVGVKALLCGITPQAWVDTSSLKF
jgi:hypothetical protein